MAQRACRLCNNVFSLHRDWVVHARAAHAADMADYVACATTASRDIPECPGLRHARRISRPPAPPRRRPLTGATVVAKGGTIYVQPELPR
jgi:hypothetical protein